MTWELGGCEFVADCDRKVINTNRLIVADHAASNWLPPNRNVQKSIWRLTGFPPTSNFIECQMSSGLVIKILLYLKKILDIITEVIFLHSEFCRSLHISPRYCINLLHAEGDIKNQYLWNNFFQCTGRYIETVRQRGNNFIQCGDNSY